MQLQNDIDFIYDNDRICSVVESSHHPFTAPVPEDEHLLCTGNSADIEKVHLSLYSVLPPL